MTCAYDTDDLTWGVLGFWLALGFSAGLLCRLVAVHCLVVSVCKVSVASVAVISTSPVDTQKQNQQQQTSETETETETEPERTSNKEQATNNKQK